MKKLSVIFISVCVVVCSNSSLAQNGKEKAYTESIEAYINTDFLITGETLYYSIHCLEGKKRAPSTLSKLAYVELIGENEKPVFQTKVSLTEGRGAGDFFLPSTLPSGNYTLIVYTKWMRNFPLENFYQKQITIINPYVKPVTSETQNKVDKATALSLSNKKIERETSLQLLSDQLKYSPREKVVITIKNNDPVNTCRINLNVHRYGESDSRSANSVTQIIPGPEKEFMTILPDLRGETITGIVKESVSNKPVANTNVYLTALGIFPVFQISRTDSSGRFYFVTKSIQTQTGIQFQVDQASDAKRFEIILDDEFVNAYTKFKPSPFSIDTLVRKQIEQRNIYSQIENAYFLKKHDSLLNSIQESFFGTPDKIYKLDDFTRFPTMEDIFREYMYEVVVFKRDGKFELRLINSTSKKGSRFLNPPLLLIDGIPIFNTEALMNYNPLLIKTISLVSKPYVYSGILFDGILSANTYTGNAQELSAPIIQKEYTPWQRLKKYYSPDYSDKNLDKIPDYRVQLFWNPLITLKPGHEYIVEFYTSDVDGEFYIEALGLNSSGEEVNTHHVIEVQK